MSRRLILCAVAFLLAAGWAVAAEKQSQPAQDKAAPPAREAASKQTDATPANIRMEQVEIRGEFENPDVFYIIPRRKAEMDLGSLSMDYTKDIMTPVVQHVFEAQHAKEGQKPGAGN